MKIKTFHALTMQDALRSIKEELGPNAVILSTKQVKKGNGIFGLFGRTMVEVSAASDEHDATPSHHDRDTAVFGPPTRARIHDDGEKRNWRRPPFGEAFRESLEDGDGEEPEHRPVRLAPAPAPPAAQSWQAAPAPISDRNWEAVHHELRRLRELVQSTLENAAHTEERRPEAAHDPAPAPAPASPQRPEDLPTALAEQYRDLLDRGVEPETAWKFVGEAWGLLTPEDRNSAVAVRRALHRVIARDIRVSGPLMNLGEWKKTVIVTGPTGVGKTTTVAKLAAHYKLREKRSVALITLDTYRVAAVEQLRMYANVIGVPLDVALTKREALDCIRRLSKTELILIDTTGRSPLDQAGMDELRELISLDHPLEVHLVLAATTRQRDLVDGVARYAGIPVSRLLFTKLDEGTNIGGIYELMRKTQLPLSYFSIGQNVPDDLEVATADRLAALLLGSPLRAPEPAAARAARGDAAPAARSSAKPVNGAARAASAPSDAGRPASHQGGAWWIKR